MNRNGLLSLGAYHRFEFRSPAFRIVVVAVICVALSALAPPSVVAATYTVTTTHDSGSGSLREAIGFANANPGPDIIDFAVRGTIILTSGQMTITDSLTIMGPGPQINGNYMSRVFDIESTAVTISGLTIMNGLADVNAPHGSVGGAIYNAGGQLTLSSVVLSNNVAFGTTGNGEGGGIADVAGGTVFSSKVTMTHNLATGSCTSGLGGGVYVDATSALTLTASHIANNVAAGSPGVGGGVYTLGTFSYDVKTRITGNRASTSGDNIGP